MMVQVFADHDGDSATVDRSPRWKYEWHRFIDHLADLRTTEEFFAALDASTQAGQPTRDQEKS